MKNENKIIFLRPYFLAKLQTEAKRYFRLYSFRDR